MRIRTKYQKTTSDGTSQRTTQIYAIQLHVSHENMKEKKEKHKLNESKKTII